MDKEEMFSKKVNDICIKYDIFYGKVINDLCDTYATRDCSENDLCEILDEMVEENFWRIK